MRIRIGVPVCAAVGRRGDLANDRFVVVAGLDIRICKAQGAHHLRHPATASIDIAIADPLQKPIGGRVVALSQRIVDPLAYELVLKTI